MDKKIVLLIDDDEDDKFIFKEVVEDINLGYECAFAADGIEGLAVLNSLPRLPSFIFLDLNMPRMDGKQCLSEIKKNPKFRDVPVVIYTTSKLEVDIEESRLLGASYFLTKPGLFSDLHRAIKDVLTGKFKIARTLDKAVA